jgi:homoserine acetyltransferase
MQPGGIWIPTDSSSYPEPVRQRPVVLAVEFEVTRFRASAITTRRGAAPPLVEQFGISTIALVYGWSMGGMQAYHWAAVHPDMVERAAVVCGSARCSPYNHVFLEGVKAALTADPAFSDGRFV